MTNTVAIPFIYSLGKFVQFYVDPASFLFSNSESGTSSNSYEEKEVTPLSPSEDFPVPDGEEINPNKGIPEEKEDLPDKQEVPVEEPSREFEEDPYFPRKGDGLPPEKEGEFPQTDPV